MDHVYNDEQRMLKDSVERMIAERYTFERRKAIVASDEGFSREFWAEFADMGLLAIPFDDKHGGMGGGPIETLIVMQAFGRGIVVEPYLPTVVLAGGLLRQELTAFAIDLDGFGGLLGSDENPGIARFQHIFLRSAAMRSAGGSDEVLRNQIAERLLGMPSEIRLDKDTPFNQLTARP